MLDKYGQALTLLQRGTLYVRQTSSTLDSLEPGESAALTTLTSARDDVPLLMKRLERAEARASRDWHNYTVSSQPSGGPITGDDSLALAVEHISLQRQIIGERAKKTGKVGPIFFDVAFNYIAPVRTDSPAQELETDEPGHGEAVIATDHPTQEYASSDRKSSSHTASEQQSTGRGIWGFFGRRK